MCLLILLRQDLWAWVIRFVSASYQIRHTYHQITYTQLHLKYAHNNNSIAHSFRCVQKPERRTVYKSRINLICSQDSSLYSVWTWCVCLCLFALRSYRHGNVIIFVGHKLECQFRISHLHLYQKHIYFSIACWLSLRSQTIALRHIDWMGECMSIEFILLFPTDWRPNTHKLCKEQQGFSHTHRHTLTLAWIIPFSCLKYQSIARRDFVRFGRSALCVIRFEKF